MAEGLQKRFNSELDKFKGLQKDYQKCLNSRQQLDAQLQENTAVKEELDRLESDAKVFKMLGPVLVKQDLVEARQNVQKRIDYITGEMKRHENLIKEYEKKQEGHRETLGKIQHQLQQAQVKAAARA